ncbi:hypothetical protein GGR54DRAFT_373932 [Hypoxylon sp. NC1633]|nr:hypothetical protein GGR54DRAFT_373932 [Hypoxylon sp. NC1633]
MSFAPPQPPKPSKTLSRELEVELRVGVFDQADGSDDDPQLIIGNIESGCYGLCHIKGAKTTFIFHHVRMSQATKCRCLVRGKLGDKTTQIPDELKAHRDQLTVSGRHQMEPKLAAMVVMKIFLGLQVPEQLRIKQETVSGKADTTQQGNNEDGVM